MITGARFVVTFPASLLAAVLLVAMSFAAGAHGISGADASFVNQVEGFHFFIYLYLGAKHMVTGYDHLMFLFGVIFFLTTLRSIALYVSLFALGHSITLIAGVLADINMNAYLVDAIIGLSVVYKAFDNLDGFRELLGVVPDNRHAVFIFGLFHGFGLATKIQDMQISESGLVANLLSFNLGVEIGQLLALFYLVLLLRAGTLFFHSPRAGVLVNFLLMAGGFGLTAYQLAHYFQS